MYGKELFIGILHPLVIVLKGQPLIMLVFIKRQTRRAANMAIPG